MHLDKVFVWNTEKCNHSNVGIDMMEVSFVDEVVIRLWRKRRSRKMRGEGEDEKDEDEEKKEEQEEKTRGQNSK